MLLSPFYHVTLFLFSSSLKVHGIFIQLRWVRVPEALTHCRHFSFNKAPLDATRARHGFATCHVEGNPPFLRPGTVHLHVLEALAIRGLSRQGHKVRSIFIVITFEVQNKKDFWTSEFDASFFDFKGCIFTKSSQLRASSISFFTNINTADPDNLPTMICSFLVIRMLDIVTFPKSASCHHRDGITCASTIQLSILSLDLHSFSLLPVRIRIHFKTSCSNATMNEALC